jgi:hypothetical protein
MSSKKVPKSDWWMKQQREQIDKHSNIDEVRRKADELDLNPIHYSDKYGKKYMVQNELGKWIHFGNNKYDDYTNKFNIEKNYGITNYARNNVKELIKEIENSFDKKRQRFRKRNAMWAHAEKYTPAYLSYNLTW